MKIRPSHIQRRKQADKIVCLTAYSAPMARLLDPICDVLLVGDSLGMVVYGMENTLGVTLDMMIAHGKAVASHAARACVVVDLPYGTYEEAPDQALSTARHMMDESGCDAVKLEGGAAMADTIAHLVQNDIPVMGHIGLLPQSVEKDGGYKVQGKSTDSADDLRHDLDAITDAGAFSVVIEGTIESVSRDLSAHAKIPTIGIGASLACDGQILVTGDMLGLHGTNVPKFVKRYAALDEVISDSAQAFADDVRGGRFPNDDYTYKRKP